MSCFEVLGRKFFRLTNTQGHEQQLMLGNSSCDGHEGAGGVMGLTTQPAAEAVLINFCL